MSNTVLCLNPGSSSLRYALFASDGETEISSGHRDQLDAPDPSSYQDALGEVLKGIADSHLYAIGYRIVHGGDLYSAPTLIDDTVTERLRSFEHLAPQHLPQAIATIEIACKRFPGLQHVACFDSAFHHALPEVAKRLPLPGAYYLQGVRRYGFHGLSYEYVVGSLGAKLPRRTIIAHLGSGSSMVALLDGKPVETTMGMTPTGGLMMASRSGDLDPGVLVHLLREWGMSAEAVASLVNEESGLGGVSGLSSDMRTLLSMRSDHPAADLAIRMYCYHARKHIGALSAVLGGVDLLVFTGGIGENSEPIREEICQALDYLACETRVVPTDESRMMARHVVKLTSNLRQ